MAFASVTLTTIPRIVTIGRSRTFNLATCKTTASKEGLALLSRNAIIYQLWLLAKKSRLPRATDILDQHQRLRVGGLAYHTGLAQVAGLVEAGRYGFQVYQPDVADLCSLSAGQM